MKVSCIRTEQVRNQVYFLLETLFGPVSSFRKITQFMDNIGKAVTNFEQLVPALRETLLFTFFKKRVWNSKKNKEIHSIK